MLVERGRNFTVSVVDLFHQAVSVSNSWGNRNWTCSAVYASPITAVRKLLWSHLEQIRGSISNSWILLGDLNEILLPSEVRRGVFS